MLVLIQVVFPIFVRDEIPYFRFIPCASSIYFLLSREAFLFPFIYNFTHNPLKKSSSCDFFLHISKKSSTFAAAKVFADIISAQVSAKI